MSSQLSTKKNLKSRILCDWDLLLFSFAVSFFLLAICSKSSFLYPMNDWADVNCFFTVGRGIKHGMVPYLDLYEQKGPLLYFLFYLAALISETSFLGVFVLEVLFFSIFLFESAKIILLWQGKNVVYLMMPVIALGIVVSKSFVHGTSSEELFFPFIALSLRIILVQMKKNQPLTLLQTIILGLCAASSLWIKFTFCGYFFGLACAIMLWYITNKNLKGLFNAIAGALIGIFILSSFIMIWYALHDGLCALFQTYFIDNLTLYARPEGIISALRSFCSLMLKNWSWSIPSALGILCIIHDYKTNLWLPLTIVLSYFGLAFSTFIGGNVYIYYPLTLSSYAPLGLLFLSGLFKHFYRNAQPHSRHLAFRPLLVMLLCCLSAYFLSPNTYLMHHKKDDLPQYKFAQTIKERKPEATLLDCSFLDGGFYFASDILPTNRYFCLLNIPNPEIQIQQSQLINQGAFDYIVTKSAELPAASPYTLLYQSTYLYEDILSTYYLFEKL